MAMHQHSKRFQKKITNVTSHVRNLIILATELYNKIENLAAPIMHEVFKHRNIQYSICSQTDFPSGLVKAVNCGLRALRYLGLKIRNIVPLEIKIQRPLNNSI